MLPASTRSAAPRDVGSAAARKSIPIVFAFLAGAALTALVLLAYPSLREPSHTPAAPAVVAQATVHTIKDQPRSHYELLAMSPDELATADVALMNLLCAKGLPGAEHLEIAAALKRLDEWAVKVKSETERHLYRATDPTFADHYKHSEARLRAEFIVQVLQEDCGVHYNMERIRYVDFSNPKDMFILGMIDDANGGTCASMPVLYVAIGRRLGYPMKLALAKQHVYCRWEGETEKFNLDGAATGGLDFPPDEEYRKWPEPISDEEMASGEFLRGLTPPEELSLFMLNRGSVYHARGELTEALACFRESHLLMPMAFGPRAAIVIVMQGLPMPGQMVQVAQTGQGAGAANANPIVIDAGQEALPQSRPRRAPDDPTPMLPIPGAWTPPGAPSPSQPKP